MTIPQWVLLGFAGWTLLVLSGTIGVYRWAKILAGQASVSEWRADQGQGSDWYRRAMRAHMNCVENLPVYAAIVLCATAVQASGPLLNAPALAFLGTRILQTTTHIAFVQTERIASLRFGFFFVQVICMIVMGAHVALFAAEHVGTAALSLQNVPG